jgi:hypothetical protein
MLKHHQAEKNTFLKMFKQNFTWKLMQSAKIWSFSHQIAALTQRSTAFDGAGQPMENTIAGADTVSNPPVDCKTRTRKQRKTALKNIIPLRG